MKKEQRKDMEASPYFGGYVKLQLERPTPAHTSAIDSAKAEAQHSPLPWTIRVTRANAGAPKNIRICDNIGLTTAMIHGSATAGVTAESVNKRKDANASYIVRACNNAHKSALALASAERLADALSISTTTLETVFADDPKNISAKCCIERNREALAQTGKYDCVLIWDWQSWPRRCYQCGKLEGDHQ